VKLSRIVVGTNPSFIFDLVIFWFWCLSHLTFLFSQLQWYFL
jgi:hypothetical protein